MKCKVVFSKWLLFPLGMVVLSLSLWWPALARKNSTPLNPESAGANRSIPSRIENLPVTESPIPGEVFHLFDRSPTGSGLLLSKIKSETNHVGGETLKGDDLWLRDAQGQERFIAKGVVGAKFSPDGSKIAYATSSHELFIETLAGEPLAQVPRASDPNWNSDSSAVTFMAMPSLEYPEIQQASVYHLGFDHVTESRDKN